MEVVEEEAYWALVAWCEEVSEWVLVLEQVLEEAWRSVEGYLKAKQLTQLFSTKNNLSIRALSLGPSNLPLSYSRSPFLYNR